MTPEQYSEFRHEAIHELIHLNELRNQEFNLSGWPRWDYELGHGTLTFSEEGVPKVLATIQAIGSTSISGGTWMWAWANRSLPASVIQAVLEVRAFGETESVAELTQAELPDDESLGWAMTAIAAKVLKAKGAYRCPGENGFLYVVYSSIDFAPAESVEETKVPQVECEHGSGSATFICEHLAANPAQQWFSNRPDQEDKWPDAWCAACERLFQEQGEWNERNESKANIKAICHHCYEALRAQDKVATS